MAIKILIQSNKDYVNDLNELARAFAPDIELADDAEIVINLTFAKHQFCESSLNYDTEILLFANEKCLDCSHIPMSNNVLLNKSNEKKTAKIMIYKYLSSLTGRALPYGSLTGIRPTKLYRDLKIRGFDAHKIFINEYNVSKQNADFIREICRNQEGIYLQNSKEIDLFVNIPICTTRCSYCSFISAEYGKIKKLIEPYINQLKREIISALSVIKDNGFKLRAVYVGGGTPTSLSDEEFMTVMNVLRDLDCVEFTVEAGRPDTITDNKLKIMADIGVTRISINPQSFNDKTLETIGRAHKSQDIIERYAMARKYSFNINMDLISSLPNESCDDFAISVDKTIALKPDNITIHTLAIKKGSALKLDDYDNKCVDLAVNMLKYARDKLSEYGYVPYYMYRQKYMSGNLDNTGYCLEGKACVYNIDIMEETHSIIACGAGGISKRIYYDENRIERLANPKGIDVYLAREEILLKNKQEFFKIK